MTYESKIENEPREPVEELPEATSAGPTPVEQAVNLEQDTVAQSAEAKAAEVQTADSKAASRKSRRIFALVLSLILITIALIGFLNRDLLLKSSSEQAASGGERKILYWVDPMHPAYKSDKPGTAPDCGMDLVPVYEDGGEAASLPPGVVKISAEKQQLIGVTYGTVSYQQVSKTLRAVGRVTYDETKVAHVHSRTEGWIEDVFVDFTGKEVKKGQPLVSLYSPDLLQTQMEFLLAIKGRRELAESSFEGATAGAESLYESSRRRLELWDISEEQIKEVERTGRPIKALTLPSPASGIVLTRNAYPKQRVMPDTDLYSIVDLSTVWILADIYEYEAADVALGQTAIVTLPYAPGRAFKGQVTYIYPQLDNTTRTLKVRVEVVNPNLALKPDMYANVELSINHGRKLVVPQEAVMDSGSEQVVFVALEGGYFEPRRVQLGQKMDDNYIVLSGLNAGERIVTSGNFLIDSESKLKAASGGMGTPSHSGHGGAQPPGGSSQVDDSQRKGRAPVDHSQHQPEAAQPQEDHSQHQPKTVDQSKHKMPDASTDQYVRQPKGKRKILYWYSVMHPQYRSDGPARCPECGMDMVPKYADEK
ncbi:MAG TPA: efflux RND transporter periplasmic adaptor subunit [Blastocatellia bacterium]|nr:efflux RND transporter periplasmic adaptor subunit [Blastocatellia bacterium]